MAEFDILFVLGLIVITATAVNVIAKIFRQPPLLAYILSGVIIGPIGLGALHLTFNGIPIGITDINEIKALSELGVAFLLFSVGVESDFTKLFGVGRTVVLGGILRLLVVGAIIVGLTSVIFPMLQFTEAAYLGVILAFSSTAIVVKLLTDTHQLNTLAGRLMIGFLIVEDILVILALPILQKPSALYSLTELLPIVGPGIGILVFAYLLNKFFYPAFFRFAAKSDELLYLAAVSCCFIYIALAYSLNFSIAVGAFIAGLSLSNLPYNLEVYEKIRGLRDFFVTIFFVSLGMQINLQFTAIPLALLAIIFAIVFFIKPLVYYLVSLFEGFGNKVSLSVALGLTSISEFAFILANNGLNGGFIGKPLYSLVILIVAISMAVTPYFMQYNGAIYRLSEQIVERFFRPLKENLFFHRKLKKLEYLPDVMKGHIIVAGGGVMGAAIAEEFQGAHQIVILDNNSAVVEKCIKNGFYAIYGSADNKEIWEKLNVKDAKLLVMAIPDIKAQLAFVRAAKKINPKLAVFGRAHYRKDVLSLFDAGIDYVVMPHVIASKVCIESMYNFLKTGKISSITKFRKEFVKYLREKVKKD